MAEKTNVNVKISKAVWNEFSFRRNIKGMKKDEALEKIISAWNKKQRKQEEE